MTTLTVLMWIVFLLWPPSHDRVSNNGGKYSHTQQHKKNSSSNPYIVQGELQTGAFWKPSPRLGTLWPIFLLHQASDISRDYFHKIRMQINVREYRRGNQKWTIQRNWLHDLWYSRRRKAKQKHNTQISRKGKTFKNTTLRYPGRVRRSKTQHSDTPEG